MGGNNPGERVLCEPVCVVCPCVCACVCNCVCMSVCCVVFVSDRGKEPGTKRGLLCNEPTKNGEF